MNKPPVRLGPLALLLVLVTLALTTLAILTFSTARADMTLANRYGHTVKVRYELEAKGVKFLHDLENDPSVLSGSEVTVQDGNYVYVTASKGYTLTIIIDGNDHSLLNWEIRKDWDYDDDIGNLWDGQ